MTLVETEIASSQKALLAMTHYRAPPRNDVLSW